MMAAITVRDVNFSYANQSILKNINANIAYGKVYSLLGPSGAGKTTLLRLILGRIKPSSGNIAVLGDDPGKNNRLVGYMPQETALCMSFTVEQTLLYFANIYKLSRSEFKKRKAELNDILNLPEDELEIRELSGGQQKMVSLCLTFLHKPKLLILDEPTVGSDPVLGNCIWKYLHQCCTENIGIIIVTHYIEEAAFGNTVGIMRDGRILEEGSPSHLVQKYQQTTLEDVFLSLCKAEDNFVAIQSLEMNEDENLETVQEIQHLSPPASKLPKITRGLWLDLWILCVLIQKNLARFFQFDITFLIFLIPAFQALILCTIYNRDAVPVHTAVYNEELEPLYSQQLLNSIEKVDIYYIQPHVHDSLESALQSVKYGKSIGAVVFPKNYSDAMDIRISDPDNADNQTLKDSTLKLYVDNTNFLFATGLVDSLRQTVYKFVGKVYETHNQSRLEAPIQVKEVIYAENSKLSDYLLPGYLISFIYLSQVSISSQLLIQERKDGLFERSLVAGVEHNIVFFSYFFSSCILSIIQIVLMLSVSLLLFQVTNYGSFQLIFVLVFAQAANAVAIGLLISSTISEGFVALLISIFVTFSQLFSSGAIFPMELVEPALRKYLYYCPIAIPTDSLRNVMLRGWQFSHPHVYNGFAINILSSIVFLLVSSFIFRRYS